MVTIDLTEPPAPAASLLDGLPRRLALTLPELRYAAHLAGGAPLPFDLAESAAAEGRPLEGRLGQSRGSTDDQAYAAALAGLHAAEDTLRRRGLLIDDVLDPALAGAIGLLATPALALEIDVAVDGARATAWHRQADGAVAVLATCDGLAFELAWLPVTQWTGELARVAMLPEDVDTGTSRVPAEVDVPFHLIDAVGEALRSSRTDLVPVLVEHSGDEVVVDADADPATVLTAQHTEARGRLRVLAAAVSEEGSTEIGVVSWVLLADGWHSLIPHHADDESRMTVRRTDHTGLAAELAPVLAQVIA